MMESFLVLLGLLNRRKQSLPIMHERRKPTRREAQAMLQESVQKLEQSVAKITEEQK